MLRPGGVHLERGRGGRQRDVQSRYQCVGVAAAGRLLAWSLGISGRPKQYLGEFPLSAIDHVEAGRVNLGSLIRISLKSGATVDLEALRGESGEDFSEQLRQLTATG